MGTELCSSAFMDVMSIPQKKRFTGSHASAVPGARARSAFAMYGVRAAKTWQSSTAVRDCASTSRKGSDTAGPFSALFRSTMDTEQEE